MGKELKSSDLKSSKVKRKKEKHKIKSSRHKEKKHKHEEEYASAGEKDECCKGDIALESMPEPEKQDPAQVNMAAQKVECTREEWMLRPVARRPTLELCAEKSTTMEDKGWGVDRGEASQKTKTLGSTLAGDAPVIGDGGASWRLKALKRMQMRAENEGRTLTQIAESRGMDLAKLTELARSRPPAAALSHLSEGRRRANKYRAVHAKQTSKPNSQVLEDDNFKDSMMRRPKENDSLLKSRKLKNSKCTSDDLRTVAKTASVSVNNFANDGSFMSQYQNQAKYQEDNLKGTNKGPPRTEGNDGARAHPSEDFNRGSEPVSTGNQSAAEYLRAQLQKQVRVCQPEKCDGSVVVQLPLVDKTGRPVAGAFESRSNVRDVKSSSGTCKDGTQKPHPDDDDTCNVKTLLKQVRYGQDRMDVDRAMADSIVRSKRYKERDFDAEYDYNAGTSILKEKKKQKGDNEAKLKDQQRKAQINDFKRLTTVEETCLLCFSCSRRPKHLVVSIATTTYLRLPAKQMLAPGHCMIVPLEHVASSRQVDENVWTEMRNFKKSLIQMFHKQGKSPLFLETALDLENYRNHTAVHCIPLPEDVMAKAPLYFKKAIDDATGDWAQHHSKRCISTKQKGFHRCIPDNFPYFHVEFGIADGFVHVIDDEATFDKDLGWKTVCGLLKLPAEFSHRSTSSHSRVDQEDWVAAFSSEWARFDWTVALK